MSVRATLAVGYPALVLALYAALVGVTLLGNGGTAVFLAWLASPILFYLVALLTERDPVAQGGRGTTAGQVFKSVFSLRTQAWSFVFGDILLLPAAFAVAADRWSQTEPASRELPLWWWLLSLIIGTAAGLGFHFKMDMPAYIKAGYGLSMKSPTKLLHDLVTYPVLFSGLLFVFGPLFITAITQWQWDSHVVAILVLVAVWLVLGAVFDGNLRQKRQSKIPWGHPRYDLAREECVV